MTVRSAACLTLLLVGTLLAQQQSRPDGTIYGIVTRQDGSPASRLGVSASPVGVPIAAVLPHTQTDSAGRYRFQNLPWWGRYTVYADDQDAGYSKFSTGPSGNSHPPEVEVTPEHREAELNLTLPPKAGFLEIQLTNAKTGALIPAMRISVMRVEKPDEPLFAMSCYSSQVVLVPPDKNLLLHVTSDGFHEWNESSGRGKPLHLASGTRLRLAVQLEPSD